MPSSSMVQPGSASASDARHSAVAFPPTPIDDETELIAPAHLRGGRRAQGGEECVPCTSPEGSDPTCAEERGGREAQRAVRGVRKRERESFRNVPPSSSRKEKKGSRRSPRGVPQLASSSLSSSSPSSSRVLFAFNSHVRQSVFLMKESLDSFLQKEDRHPQNVRF